MPRRSTLSSTEIFVGVSPASVDAVVVRSCRESRPSTVRSRVAVAASRASVVAGMGAFRSGLWAGGGSDSCLPASIILAAPAVPISRARRLNSVPASATETTRIPALQAIACQAAAPGEPPASSARIASTTWLTGWLAANGRSHDGIVETGTNALEGTAGS